MAEDTGEIFARIVAGEIPCQKVYEDERVLAFLDIAPLSKGHTLVIPKARADTLDAMDEEDAAAIGRVLPRLARAVMKGAGCRAYNLLQNNGQAAHQAVAWVHFHIIPKPEHPQATESGAGLGINWPARKLDPQEAERLAERIRAEL